jgi:hypothetical protein
MANNLEPLATRLKRDGSIERVMGVQGKKREEMSGTEERRGWFRKRGTDRGWG